MSAREWKPGDVAMAPGGLRVYYYLNPHGLTRWLTGDSGEWVGDRHELRPLVVLDPEDTERMARLAVQILSDRCNGNITYTTLAHSLRCFDAPPKPAEPTGLGAVVETAEGSKFVRLMDDPEFPWALSGEPAENRWHWERMGGLKGQHVVRVLSEGVVA